ncbi:glutaredoxin [Blyttiomyces sp. JEL0837]|nr:glutaredoxin [Blyttiomyces sp. JEL0837]
MLSFLSRLFSSAAPITVKDMSAAKEIAEQLISSNHVTVFSKSYCPYCRKAKGLLDTLKVQYVAIELDNRPDGDAIQGYLAQKTGQRTVPNIFIDGAHVGGCDDLHAKHSSGELKKLLKL